MPELHGDQRSTVLVIAVGEDVKLVEKETVSMYSGHHVTTKGHKIISE
jgi:hypothetical protein